MTKYFFAVFSMLTLILSIVGCKEDVNLNADFEETAIIYGLLDTYIYK